MINSSYKTNFGAVVVIIAILAWFIWMNTPNEVGEQQYSMPPIEGPVRSFDYANNKWRYYEKDEEKKYTQHQVDSIRRHAQNMLLLDFEDLMEEYEDEIEAWQD